MAENTAADDKQAESDLAAGFLSEAPPEAGEKAEPEAKAAAPKVEPKKVEPKVEAKTPEPKAPEAAKPEYVQITREQLARYETAAEKTVTLEAQLSKAFGTVGNLKQVVERLQAATPAGQAVEITDKHFAKLEKDFPELAAYMREDLGEILKGFRGTGSAQAATADPDAMKKLVSDAEIARAIEDLEDAHPAWRTIVGNYGDEKKGNEFRQWLAKQPAEYQTKVNSTNNAAVITRSIDRFLASKKAVTPGTPSKPAPKVAARTDRIRAAIQPRGAGGPPAPTKTADDEFHAGFREG